MRNTRLRVFVRCILACGTLLLLNCGNRSAVGLAEIASLSSCAEWKQNWPQVLEKARTLSSRSGLKHRLLSETLSAQSHLCEHSLPEFFTLLESVQNVAPEFNARIVQHGQLTPFLPSRIRVSASETKIEMVAFSPLLDWIFNNTREEAKRRICAAKQLEGLTGLPPKDCRASWLFMNVVENERLSVDPKNSILKSAQQRIAAAVKSDMRELQSWPAAWSAAWLKGWPDGARILLEQRSIEDLVPFVAENSTTLLPIFVGSLNERESGYCLKALALVRGLKAHIESPARDENALRLVAGIAASVCPSDRRMQNLMFQARQAIPDVFTYAAPSTPYSDVGLLQYVNDALNDDLALRSDLALHFSYGLEEDAREISTSVAVLRDYVRDSILMNSLRGIAPLPWVRTLNDIDNRAMQVDFAARVLWKLGRTLKEGDRFLQFAFLAFADVADQSDGSGVSSETLVRQIRESSTALASQLPQMQPLVYEIHNGLHSALAASVIGVIDSLSESEKGQYEHALRELATKIELFFRRHNLSPEALRTMTAPFAATRPKLEQDLNQLLDVIASPQESRLALWLKMSERLFSELKRFENENSARPTLANNVVSGAPSAQFYLQLLRLAAEVNAAIGAELGAPHLASEPHLGTKYLRHLSSFSGIALHKGCTLDSALGDVTTSLQQMFRSRVSRFEWFLWLQAHREVRKVDYSLSVAYRRAALPFLVEKLIRDSGLHLAARLVPHQTDVGWRAMNPGVAFGQLTIVPKEKLPQHQYRRNEILITNGIPLNLGVTAGLVTEVFQPRASHIDLRTRERGTPNAFVRNAFEQWANLEGKTVRLEVGDAGVTISEVHRIAGRIDGAVLPLKTEVPAIEASEVRFVDGGGDEAMTTVARVGAKSFGYAHLLRIFGRNGPVAPALFIPFAKYLEIVREPKIQERVNTLRVERSQLNETELGERLKELRTLIKERTRSRDFLESDWMTALLEKLQTLSTATVSEGHGTGWSEGCFRFRSSTNSEDLINFQGAGLYESKTGCLHQDASSSAKHKSVAEALGGVWASLWTDRAFAEREYYGIDHGQVGMAILVHRNWDDESANGVLLTRSLIDSSYLISIQPGEDLVTNPDGSQSGEEIVATLSAGGLVMVSRMSSGEKRELLSLAELEQLVRAAERIHQSLVKVFRNSPQLPALRFDVEFKFVSGDGNTATRKLVLKQARPTGG